MVEAARVLVWPVVVVILVLLFRLPLSELIKRIKSLEVDPKTGRLKADTVIPYSEAGVDSQRRDDGPVDSSLAPSEVDWSKHATLFWLANDMVWTVDALLRGAPARTIAWNLNQSLHHLGELGLAGTEVAGQLRRLAEEANGRHDADWTIERRNDAASTIESASWKVGELAQSAQPGFKPWASGADPATKTFPSPNFSSPD